MDRPREWPLVRLLGLPELHRAHVEGIVTAEKDKVVAAMNSLIPGSISSTDRKPMEQMNGQALDNHGQLIGIHRRQGEQDSEYRERIRRMLTPPPLGTPRCILDTVEDAVPWCSGASLHESPGRVRVRMELPLWRRLLWFPARSDRKLAAAALVDVMAAGVDWRVS